MNSLPIPKGLLFLLLLPALVACAPVVKEGQPAAVQSATLLQPGQSAGQTFTARDRGLNGVEVFLSPGQPGAGEIRLHLRTSAQATTDLAVGTLAASAVSAPGFYRFAFAPQADSRGRDYYLLLDAQGDAKVHVGTAAGDTYLDGALYQNGNPVDAQMTFRLTYDPVELMIGLAALAVTWLQVLVVTVLLFVLPGWALLAGLLPGWSARSWGGRLGLASGMSLALYPLLMLWTNVVGLHLGALYAWLPVVAAIGVQVWRNRAWRPRIAGAWQGIGWDDLALAALIGLIVGVRFWVIRSLDVPMWGDSYQHTMIAQLLANNGGLFDSWQPYAELQTFTYHFGFHSAAAVFHWLSGVDLPQSVLWTGQILNGLAVLALYPLAVHVGGSRWAGLGAVVVAGLLAPMPMYYLNWGRYTQLAGQVILPVAVYITWRVLETRSRNWGLLVVSWVVIGGLALTHYRILIFALFFLAVLLLLEIKKGQTATLLFQFFWIGLGGGLLFLPWFIHVFAGKYLLVFASQMTTFPGENSIWSQTNGLPDLYMFLPVVLWLFLLVSIGWGLWRRNLGTLLISLWWLLLILAANPEWLQLPGAGVLSSFTVFIAIYIPLGILGGAAIGWLVEWQQHRRIVTAIFLLLMVGIGLWGARQRLSDIHVADSALVTRPDVKAAAWIRENTPPSARFLINSFSAYSDTVVVGSDGGWWLPFLANRQNSVPPINYASEEGPRPDYREWVNKVSTEVAAKGIDHPDVLALLREREIGYVYIGQRQGRVNYNGQTLDPQLFLSSPHYRALYHQDRTWVFEIVK